MGSYHLPRYVPLPLGLLLNTYTNLAMCPGYSHSWEDIAFLKEHWKGPIVLKGIQTVRDAKKAVEVGVQGIVVSNRAWASLFLPIQFPILALICPQ